MAPKPARARIRTSQRRFQRVAAILFLGGCLVLQPTTAFAAATEPIALGTAANFSVLAGTAVTTTGSSFLASDAGVVANLGVSPGDEVSGFLPADVTSGTIHVADALAAAAQADLTSAFIEAAGIPCDEDLTGQDLGGRTLTPGVYCVDGAAQLSGGLNLEAEGNPDAVFLFQISSTLTLAPLAFVERLGGTQTCNVFWQVGDSVTMGASVGFTGNLMAQTSISVGTNDVIRGRLHARIGAISMNQNSVSTSDCAPDVGVPLIPLLGSAGSAIAVVVFLVGIAVVVLRCRIRLATT